MARPVPAGHRRWAASLRHPWHLQDYEHLVSNSTCPLSRQPGHELPHWRRAPVHLTHDAGPKFLHLSPVTIHFLVENVDAVVAQAVAARAGVTMPIADMFWGDR
jgi:hypothetical protein